MAGISMRAGVVVFFAAGSLFATATGQAGDAVVTSGNDAANPEAEARMEALRSELGTASTALSEATRREIALREEIVERAAQSQSYEEALTDEDSRVLLAKIKTLSAELDALRLELKTRMEANATYKARETALRELHAQVVETRLEIRRLQQERSRLAVELKALEDAAAEQAASSAPQDAQSAPGPAGNGDDQ